jgi:hypothetical protein
MKIHKITNSMYYGGSIDYPDDEHGIPFGYTRSPLPDAIIIGETSESPPSESESEQSPAELFLKWNGYQWEYTTVPPPPEQPDPIIISKLGFLNRLGEDEYISILTASKTDVVVEAWINRFNLSSTLDLADSKLQNTLSKFVEKGLITQQKLNQILFDPLLPSE